MENTRHIAVDLGNSNVKIGIFINRELREVLRFSWTDLMENPTTIQEWKSCTGICSSVLTAEQNKSFSQLFPEVKILDETMKMPFAIHYKTPNTLGKDRLCNAAAAHFLKPNQNTLVVDVGTCIKYDLLTADGTYQGGAISPGLRLRYQSLNDYTANLPLLNETAAIDLVGKSTYESIHSGVINGMKAEIVQIIEQYEGKYESLTIFVTGGDAKHFDLDVKNNIFANKNLTLEGLFQIFLFNA